jgi:D-aminoacyl-tRNA deacylase
LKALLQRVTRGAVSVDAETVGSIGQGLVILLGVAAGDAPRDADYLVEKTLHLRIFPDTDGKFDRSLLDTQGEAMVVSQFTLLADTRRGRRPGFTEAAPPEQARTLCDYFTEKLRAAGIRVASGIFQAHMAVDIVNDGPVTIMLDSRDKFGG